MATHHLSIDIETKSSVDIGKAGLYKYAQSEDFEILLFAYKRDSQEVQIVDLASGEIIPEHILNALGRPDVIKHAYNAAFEWYCLNRAGYSTPLEQWRCTMAHGLYCGYTAGLDATGKAIGLPQDKQKLTAGKALIRYFCVPCKPTKSNGNRRWNLPAHAPEKWELFKEYCRQDVVTEHEILRRLKQFPMPEEEIRLWQMDIKMKTLWQNSVLKWAGSFLKMVLMHIGIVWKIILAFGAFVLIHWIAMMVWDPGIWFFLMLLAEGAAFVYLMRGAIGKSRIKRGVEAIARGQVEYQIPLTGLRGEQLEVAKYINKIGDGLDKALEESMKNERLKTDLITNVSHDIKTPLTSIINYVELLKRENFEDPRIQNYLKVLEEKAFRLKTLTEDVVEASKVSSGNIKLEMMNLNLIELINQTSAEFDEKFEARDLQFILHTPSEPVIIYADGRRMWRVFANVFSNAAKYAMEHSRVYADLYQNDREVFFTIKNISEQPLNISPDELTERFIRGDVSRSTEGSGLGLSIARNLTELQGGSFELYLDGDLFKVMIRFPRVRTEEQDSDEGEAKAADNGPLEGNGYSYCGDIGRKDI